MIVTGAIAVASSAAGIAVVTFTHRVLADASVPMDPWAAMLQGGSVALVLGFLGLIVAGKLYTAPHVRHLNDQISRQYEVIDELRGQVNTLIQVGHEGTVPLLRETTQRAVSNRRIERLLGQLEDRLEGEGEAD